MTITTVDLLITRQQADHESNRLEVLRKSACASLRIWLNSWSPLLRMMLLVCW